MPLLLLANADDPRAPSGDHAITKSTLFGDPFPLVVVMVSRVSWSWS